MSEKLKRFVYLIVMIFFEVFLYFQMIFNKPEITIKYKLVFLILCILSNIVSYVIFMVLDKNKKIKVEKIFLIIAILFGGLYLIFIPAILGTDELPHFLRPYQISVGDVIVKHPERNETKIPKALDGLVSEHTMSKRYTKENIFKSVDYSDTKNLWNGDVTSIKYSPIPYLPQIVGFWGARLFKLGALPTMYFVRLINFITWLVISYFSIKLLPTKKIFAVILYTSPAVLSIVSTCSGDAFALSLFLLLISYILNIANSKRNLTKKDYILLFLISFGISTYKVFYVLYVLLLLLIPYESFNKDRKRKIIYLSTVIFVSFLADFLWFSLTSINSTIGSNLVSKQINFILNNPLKYFLIFINTYINDIYYYSTNFVAGTEMCYGLAKINQLFILSYLFILILSNFDGSKKNNISRNGRILISLVSLAIFVLVSTTLYMDWTSKRVGIGATKIVGIQSRYFLPLIIPIVSMLPYCKKKFKDSSNLFKYSTLLNCIMLVNCISSLLIYVFPN